MNGQKKFILLFFFTISLFVSCIVINDPANIFYKVEVKVSNCDVPITNGRLICDGDFEQTIQMEKIGDNYVGFFYSCGMGPQNDFKEVPINELDNLESIISGGKFIINNQEEISYTKDNVNDVTTRSDLYRCYRILLEYTK